jgi:inorganic triphosphatase YgiF
MLYCADDVLAGTDMSVETELKLRIAPEHLNRLKRHPLLKKLSTSSSTNRKLYSVYYDTPDLELHQRSIALRLRRIGKRWVQTLKDGGGVMAGLHQRNEWEAPVAGKSLDFEVLEASGGPRLPKFLRKKLQPLFVTDFTRTTYMLVFEGAKIELCMDCGAIRSGQFSQQISELELELKSGKSAQLFNLTLVLLDIVPLTVEHTNKAEYGYRLLAHTKPAAVKASTPIVTKCPDLPCALQTIIWSCMFHLQVNIPGAVQQIDEEYLHQVRIALRRLRVLLSLAETFHTDTELTSLQKQIAQLSEELGMLREWDVFVTLLLKPFIPQLSKQAGPHLLLASEKLREQHRINVATRLQSPEYQRLVLHFGAWMHCEYWSKQNIGGLSLVQFAQQNLNLHYQRIVKRGKQLATANPKQLHRLRISCKKLRYSAEAFASLFDKNKTNRFQSDLALLQECLGTLNDYAVSLNQLDELDAQAQQRPSLLIATLVMRGWIKHGYTNQLNSLNKVWKKFSNQEVFWQD